MSLSRADRVRRLLLAAVVLFLGGSGLVYEYCLSTLASHLLGNSIEQFSLIIALMLFAMGVAGLAQRALRDPAKLADRFIAVEIALAVVGGAAPTLLYLTFAWTEHFQAALYGLALLIGFGIGLEIPLLLRLNESWRDDLRENVGDVFSLDYLGALLGALVWAFLLLPRLALDRVGLVLGLANLLAAVVTFFALRRRVCRPAGLIAAKVVATACLVVLWFHGPSWIETARQHLYAAPILHHARSPYQDIVITGRDGRLSLFLNGHLQFDSEDEYIYHELLVHPALMSLDRPPREVLVLGGGDGLAVREVLRWPGVERVTLVDLDPVVTELARTWPAWVALNQGALLDARVERLAVGGLTEGETVIVEQVASRGVAAIHRHATPVAEVRLLHLDADAFLREVTDRYDAILCDFPDPSSPDLAKLFSLEFYLQARLRLRTGGVIAVQAGSPYGTRRAFWAIRDTLAAADFHVIALHAHVPTFGEWGWLVGRRDQPPDPRGTPPIPTDWLDAEVLAAARVFPRPLDAPPGGPVISTRLDPRVMTLYREGEPLGSRGRAVR